MPRGRNVDYNEATGENNEQTEESRFQKIEGLDMFRFVHTVKDEGYWVMFHDNSRTRLKKDVDLEMNRLLYESGINSAGKIREIKLRIAAIAHIEAANVVGDDNIIHLANGMYFLNERDFVKYEEEDRIEAYRRIYNLYSLSFIDASYIPNSPAVQEIDEFLNLTLGEIQVSRLFEMFAYIMMNRIDMKTGFIFVGEPDTGKTTLGGVLVDLVGRASCALESFHRICTDPFSAGNLEGKHLCYDDDLGKRNVENFEEFKKLTGYWLIRIERKGVQAYMTKNITKFLTCANEVPYVEGMDNSFSSRWCIFLFTHVFTRNSGGQERFRKVALSMEGKQYLIRRAIESIPALLSRGHFEGMSREEVHELWMRKSNVVYGFIRDCCILENGASILNYELYNYLIDYSNRIRWTRGIPGMKVLTTSLRKLGVTSSPTRIEGRPVREYRGIRYVGYHIENNVHVGTRPPEPFDGSVEDLDFMA